MRYLLLFLLSMSAFAADNTIMIDQVGNDNTVIITQEGVGHSASVVIGNIVTSDSNAVTITQQGTGIKTAGVEIQSGINNGVTINQDGSGNHVSNIQNLNGSANNITVGQTGDGNHTFNLLGGIGTTNSGNTVTAIQSGGVGADKNFTLNMNGTGGANVNIQQTNPTQANTGNMSITCNTGSCGTYNYTRQ